MKKKILSLLTAFAMVFGIIAAPFTSAKAADEKVSKEPNAVTKTVTLHKMLVTKENIKARKVTVTEGKKSTSKVVIEKEENGVKSYTDGAGAALNANNENDKKFIDGYASGTPVFAGYEGLDGTKYDGQKIDDTAKYFGTSEEMDNVFFAWQVVGKEKDNTNKDQYIKGKLVGGVMTPDYKETTTGEAPNQTTTYEIQFTTKLDEAFGGYTANKTGIKFDTSKLKGQFKIQEIKEKSKYIGKDKNGKPEKSIVDQRAVPVEITLPLVNSEGTVIDAHVYPKNVEDKPEIDKNFVKRHGLKEALEKSADPNATINDGAKYENYQKEKAKVSADVGRVIPYEVKTKIAKGTSYEKLVWNDIMTNGLTYNKDLGTSKTYKDLLVKDENDQEATKDVVTGIKAYKKGAGAQGADVEIKLEAKDYIIKEDDKGFRLMFTADGLKKISDVTQPADQNGTAQPSYDVEIQLVYTATVNGSTVVDNPEKNNITLEYGHKKGKDIEEKDVTPKNKEIVVNKSFDPELDEQAKKDLVLAYTLKEGNTVIGTVALTSTDAAGKIFDLGNGIKFEVTGEFKGKFTGLDDKKTYKFSERVAGYNPEYTDTDQNGQVIIVNKKDNDNPPPLNPTEPKVVTGGKKFVKTNDKNKGENGLRRLVDAQFLVKREVKDGNNTKTEYLVYKNDANKANDKQTLTDAKKAYTDLITAYNKAIAEATGETVEDKENNVKLTVPAPTKENPNATKELTGKTAISTEIEKYRKAYEQAFKLAGSLYEWKADQNNANRVVLVSDVDGRFEIQGLDYGSYKLEEIKTPEGFAKIADQEFTVGAGTYDGANTELNYKSDTDETEKYGQQVKNKEVTIPQTGGIGSLIFIVAGLAIMAGAFVAYKKSQAVEA